MTQCHLYIEKGGSRLPTDTFMKLSKEKQDKILIAAKNEFARVPFEETSIKNIVEKAGIARGSFYQYFESKEDLLQYLMKDQMEKVDHFLQKVLQEKKGDIFEVFIAMYDYMMNEIFNETDCNFHRRIFENMKTSEDTFFIKPFQFLEPFQKENIYGLIDQTVLKAKNEKDVRMIIKMLYLITRKALVSNFKYNSKEEARKDFLCQIEYLKYGTCQN